MQEILNKINPKIYISIAIFISGILIYMILKKALNKLIQKGKGKDIGRKKKTFIKLLDSVLKYVLLIVFLAIILQVNGIDVSSLLAGIGIVSVTVGLALQDALKDIIMGMNIILDDYFAVGDMVKINDVEGKVIELGLKSTKIMDVITNSIYVVANRNISSALNYSKMLDINIPLPYEEPIEKIEKVLNKILKQVSQMEEIESASYQNIKEFGDSAIFYKIRVYCDPEFHLPIKRKINRIIKMELDKNGIEIPYMQIDLHNK
ncbi:MAG: mechanosensitive ion channel family protein [Clostridia bacterium]|nr:mechanosensitive ion channel family protein [Clostridia bacterium]